MTHACNPIKEAEETIMSWRPDFHMNGMTKGGQGASWFSITHMGPNCGFSLRRCADLGHSLIYKTKTLTFFFILYHNVIGREKRTVW